MNNNEGYKAQLIKKSFWLFLGRALPVVILFAITILYSRRLSYSDYGTFQSVWMYANIISIIISFGFSSVIFSTNLPFLFSFLKKNKKLITIFYFGLWLISLVIFFFTAKNFDTTTKFLLIAFMIIQNVITIGESLLIKRGKEKISFIINLLYSLSFFSCHLVILLSNYSLANLIAGICIVSVLKLIAIILVPVKKETGASFIEEKDFLKHWNYLGLNEILGVISKWIDKVFLLYLLSISDFAIFFNGSFEIPLFGLLISVAGSLMLIEFSANLNNIDKIQTIFKETFNMLSAIVFPLFFFLFFFREDLFSFVFKNKYNASIPIFTISIFIILIRINNYSSILQCFSQGKKIMIGSIIDIAIALFLMCMLYPLMGSKGIALSIVIATYCQVYYYLWHSAKLLKIKLHQLFPLQKLVIKFLILLTVYFITFLLLRNFPMLLKLASVTALSMLLVIAGMWNYFKTFFKKNHVQISKNKF